MNNGKVKIYAKFPPIKNEKIRKLRPFLRAIGLHRPGNVTIKLEEMTQDSTYAYLLKAVEAFNLMSQPNSEGKTLIEALHGGFTKAISIVQQNPGIYAIATGIDDPEFYGSLEVTQARILEQAIEQANPVIEEERRRMEYLYLLHTGLLEQAQQAEQIVTQQAQKEEVA